MLIDGREEIAAVISEYTAAEWTQRPDDQRPGSSLKFRGVRGTIVAEVVRFDSRLGVIVQSQALARVGEDLESLLKSGYNEDCGFIEYVETRTLSGTYDVVMRNIYTDQEIVHSLSLRLSPEDTLSEYTLSWKSGDAGNTIVCGGAPSPAEFLRDTNIVIEQVLENQNPSVAI